VDFFKAQATESLLHAQQVGEILTGLEGHPSQRIAPIEESYQHFVRDILEESLNHEKKALGLYKQLLNTVENASVYLEEFARTMIGQEELHTLEIKKMLRDFS
jgi:bacterioferritin